MSGNSEKGFMNDFHRSLKNILKKTEYTTKVELTDCVCDPKTIINKLNTNLIAIKVNHGRGYHGEDGYLERDKYYFDGIFYSYSDMRYFIYVLEADDVYTNKFRLVGRLNDFSREEILKILDKTIVEIVDKYYSNIPEMEKIINSGKSLAFKKSENDICCFIFVGGDNKTSCEFLGRGKCMHSAYTRAYVNMKRTVDDDYPHEEVDIFEWTQNFAL